MMEAQRLWLRRRHNDQTNRLLGIVVLLGDISGIGIMGVMGMFTKGPWKIGFADGSGCGENGEGIWIIAGEDEVIVRGGKDCGVSTGVEGEDNANLISAAPDMYEALKELEKLANKNISKANRFAGAMRNLDAYEMHKEWQEAMILAYQALAKAEGR